MGIDRALIALKVVTQDLLNKLHTCIYTTRIACKRGEELELRSGEVNLFALNQHLMT